MTDPELAELRMHATRLRTNSQPRPAELILKLIEDYEYEQTLRRTPPLPVHEGKVAGRSSDSIHG